MLRPRIHHTPCTPTPEQGTLPRRTNPLPLRGSCPRGPVRGDVQGRRRGICSGRGGGGASAVRRRVRRGPGGVPPGSSSRTPSTPPPRLCGPLPPTPPPLRVWLPGFFSRELELEVKIETTVSKFGTLFPFVGLPPTKSARSTHLSPHLSVSSPTQGRAKDARLPLPPPRRPPLATRPPEGAPGTGPGPQPPSANRSFGTQRLSHRLRPAFFPKHFGRPFFNLSFPGR